jgi:creatinine amidohydrolase
MDDLFLEHLSWPDVAAALEEGYTTVVVPVGAVEQHGPHLPLCVDAERGTRLGFEIAKRLGRALMAPTIRVGCSDHHMSFPGTLSLRESTLRAVCTDYCVSLSRHGFTRICLVPSHGGNFAPLSGMLDDLRQAVEPGCTVLAYTDLLGFLEVWKRILGEAGMGERVGGHADVAEGSEMLAIRPDLVKTERAEAGYLGETSGELLDRIFREGLQAVTANGILGDARGLSAELGERCLAEGADVIASFFAGSLEGPPLSRG